MNKVAEFEKVSYEEFLAQVEIMEFLDESEIKKIYDSIELPTRSTAGSAGYDFHIPWHTNIPFGKSVLIPTGIKCKIENGWFLGIYPRSGHGFKYGITITNTVGIIDSDYYNNENNEGHIMVKITNDNHTLNCKELDLDTGAAFCQGILMPFGVTYSDNSTNTRIGGMGSTDSQ